MGGAGDDEIQPLLPLPEKFLPQPGFRKQDQLVIELLLAFLFAVLGQIVGIIHIVLVAHGLAEHIPAVKIGVVVVEGFGRIPLPCQHGSQGLVIGIGHIVEGIAALAGQEGAGVDAELGVEGPDAAVGGRIKGSKVDALCHQLGNGGGMVADHPVIHGFHQHQHDVFVLQQARHVIGLNFRPGFKISIDLLPGFLLLLPMGRCQGVEHIGRQILCHGVPDTTDLIEPVGAEHILVGRLCRLHPAIIGLGIPDAAVLLKDLLGQAQQAHNCRCRQNGTRHPGSSRIPEPGVFPDQPRPQHQQQKDPDKPARGVAEDHIQIVRPLGGIAELRQPHHFRKQLVIAGLAHGVHQSRPIEQAEGNAAACPGQQGHQAAEDHGPETTEGQRPVIHPGFGTGLKIAECK